MNLLQGFPFSFLELKQYMGYCPPYDTQCVKLEFVAFSLYVFIIDFIILYIIICVLQIIIEKIVSRITSR
jgi:hypothetical protein